MTELHTDTTPTAEDLLAKAAAAHRNVNGEPGRALAWALDAGDALTAAKQLVARGQWRPALAAIELPASTARLYMLLAAHRSLIEQHGCTSIRQARKLVTAHRANSTGTTNGDGARRPRAGRRSGYENGYRDGYDKGRRDGYANGRRDAGRATPSSNGDRAATSPLSKTDIKWMLRRMHPDVVSDKDKDRAHRAAVWLNAVNATR